MQVTFADIPLAMPDHDHEWNRWYDRYLSAKDLQLFAPAFNLVDGRLRTQAPNGNAPGPRVPNFPSMPRLKVNSLYIPTGASRWSVGLFLASNTQATEIVTALRNSGSTSGSVKIAREEDNGTNTEYTLHLLQVRRLSEDLRLLILVDERYFWQFRSVEDLDYSPDNPWSGLIDALSTTLGKTIDYGTLPDAYLAVDNYSVASQYDNLAAALDSVAGSIQRRVVYDPTDESVKMQGPDDANSAALANLTKLHDTWPVVAGGEHETGWRMAPAAVEVSFPRWEGGYPSASGERAVITEAAADHLSDAATTGTIMPADTVHTIWTTADGGESGTDIDVPGERKNLASQIADDFYLWLTYQYDITLAGLPDWTISGCDDYVWHHFGYQEPQADEPHNITTRVCTYPRNFASTDNQSQGSIRAGTSTYFKAYEDWTNPESGMPYVVCQPCSRAGVVSSVDTYTIYLPRTGGGDPAVYEDEVIAAKLVAGDLVYDNTCNSRLKDIKFYSGAYDDIQTGWVLADGAALPADKKVSATNAPDITGRVIMGIDTDGIADENAIGDTGGFRWHGETENNHADHDNHQHNIRMTSIEQENVDAGTEFKTWDIDSSTDSETSGVEATDENPTNTDILNHKGTIDNDSYFDTDNRQRYIVEAAIYRYK